MSELSAAKNLVAEATADRVTWGDGTEYINVEDAARLVVSAEQRGVERGLSVAEGLLRAVEDYWEGRPLAHHGEHIHADLLDVLRAITPVTSEATP